MKRDISMPVLGTSNWLRWIWIQAGYWLVVLAIAAAAQEGGRTRVPLSANQAFIDGERMYRKGILPSGKPLAVAIQGDVSVPGTTFACASCHNRSGVAVMDETQRIPSINSTSLFRTLYPIFPNLSDSEREELPARYQAPPLRPAYTHATLSKAIREGIDPKGRSLKPTMPRYALSDRDMTILINYLKQLSSEPSPGVTDTNIALATVITEDVSQADRDAMLNSLDEMVKTHNAIGNSPGDMRRMVTMQVMYLSFRSYSLSHWMLKGAPNTWRAQLEKSYQAEPVFALVGGFPAALGNLCTNSARIIRSRAYSRSRNCRKYPRLTATRSISRRDITRKVRR